MKEIVLAVCFVALSVTVLLGSLLAAGQVRRLAVVHGVFGVLGTVALGLALRRAALHGPFAWDAFALAVAALAGGTAMWTVWRRGRRPGLVVFLHASAGGLAYLLVAGFVF